MTTATLLAGSLVLATSCATSPPAARPAPQAPAEQAVTPVTTAPTTGPSKGPEPVKPTGDAINVHKVRWTKATPVARGKQVRLTWWSGVAPCTVLDKVKVKETAKKVTITLYEGASPKARNVSCILLAVEKTTTVKLKHALGNRKLVDGAKP
ncbi:hypothetical protein ACIBIZ_16775 [Nonomuraea spiralis]|uniref:hypothetical protein n=1 Tax=Nonomuraea spiralis TaxID=46182 RepID=UPI003796A5C5